MKFVLANYNSKDYKKFLKLRMRVFCYEQNIAASLECENEEEAIYFVVKTRFNKIVSGARYRKTSDGYKIERMLTIKKYRGKGYGSFLITNFIAYAKLNNLSPIYLNAQEKALAFYEKLGFIKVGAQFLEANIWHQKMILSINH